MCGSEEPLFLDFSWISAAFLIVVFRLVDKKNRWPACLPTGLASKLFALSVLLSQAVACITAASHRRHVMRFVMHLCVVWSLYHAAQARASVLGNRALTHRHSRWWGPLHRPGMGRSSSRSSSSSADSTTRRRRSRSGRRGRSRSPSSSTEARRRRHRSSPSPQRRSRCERTSSGASRPVAEVAGEPLHCLGGQLQGRSLLPSDSGASDMAGGGGVHQAMPRVTAADTVARGGGDADASGAGVLMRPQWTLSPAVAGMQKCRSFGEGRPQ